MDRRIKAVLIGLTCSAGVSGFAEGARAQGLDEILECRSIADELERLRCFDKTTDEAAKLIASASAEDDGASRTMAQADFGDAQSVDDAQSMDEAFGAEDLREQNRDSEKEESKTLRAKLVGLRFTQSGRYVITLDNGQVWRQIGGDTDRLHLPSVSGNGVPVIIKKKLFGSHSLRPASSKRSIRVERVE